MTSPEAAVGIVRARGVIDSVLLIRRAESSEDHWSGHWCFPGGRREPRDPDLLHTALREIEEECGVKLTPEHLESALPLMRARRRVGRYVQVAPFLFSVEKELDTVLDLSEAVEALWVPLSLLLDRSSHMLGPVAGYPPEVLYPGVPLNGVPLWGFTYRLITDWLGLWLEERSEAAGDNAAHRILEHLVSRGLGIKQAWVKQNADGVPASVALVAGKIPVAEVIAHFSRPENFLPAINALEVSAAEVHLVGPMFERYSIRVSRD